MDVADWLRTLGLERYQAAFLEHEITSAVLPNLSAGDLEKIGVMAVGHQHRLLEAIAALRARSEPARIADHSPRDDLRHTTAERRQLSVMFCDMSDSTALSTRLDPEDLSTVIREYQSRVAATVARFGGYIARYVGDGVLIYFGWPAAHENNAERAVRAALAVIAAVAEAPVQGEILRLRIGIATGLVVIGAPIGSGEARQQTAIGETPNLAARLQGFAGTNGIAIDETTRGQVGELFEVSALGALQLKGFPDPVAAFLVLRESAVDSRFHALRGGALTPLVGRDAELALLREAWEQTKSGRAQAVVVAGEAGLGKSRLIAELEQQLGTGTPARLHYYCSPDQTDTALHPLIAGLSREAGFTPGDTDDERHDKLRLLLQSAPPADIALIADLLSITPRHRPPVLDAGPQARKEATFAALIARIRRLSLDDPLLLVLEDTHWADASTRELLEALIPALADRRALCIFSTRNDDAPTKFGPTGIIKMNLARLDRGHAQALAISLAPTTLAPQLLDQIVEQTDGVPLFVEELTKTMVEAVSTGDAAGPMLAVPTSLQASLMARLDRIPVAKDVAQIGAVFGREFSAGLLAAVSKLPEATLRLGLHQLVEAGLATREGSAPDASYVFKHALVRDTAYNMLLRSRRRDLHARVAAALQLESPELRERQPELLAHHYTQALLVEPAIACWGAAARRSAARSAVIEAIAQLRQALALVPELPEGTGRLRQELDLQTSLGGALFACHGWSDGSATQAYARALNLAEQVGDIEATARMLAGQVTYHIGQCQYAAAQDIATTLLRLASRSNLPSVRVMAHRCMGVCLHWTGDCAGALEQFDAVIALYDPERDRPLAAILGFDVRVQTALLACWDLLILGRPDQAAQRFALFRSELHDVHHKHSQLFALAFGAVFSLLMQDREAAFEQLTEALALAAEQRFTHVGAWTRLILAAQFTVLNDAEAGLAQARYSYETYVAATGASQAGTGLVLNATYFLGLLAQACEAAGAEDEAGSLLDRALDGARRSGEGWFEPELHRLKAEWLLHHVPESEARAEAAFGRAIDLAERRKALLWVLRSTVSLARLYRAQGRLSMAREVLTRATGRFSEGQHWPELVGAKALLADLSS